MKHITFLDVPPPIETGDSVPDLDQEVGLFGLSDIDVVRGLAWALPLFVLALCFFFFCFSGSASTEPRRPVLTNHVDVTLDPEIVAQLTKRYGSIGDPLGTNTVDPALARALQIPTRLPRVLSRNPDERRLLDLRKQQATAALAISGLPMALDGNGLPFGDGGLGPDGIQCIKQVLVANQSLPGVSVRVRLLIGADGVPISATPISGPMELHAQVVDSALQWRYRVPEALKPHAPFVWIITFYMW